MVYWFASCTQAGLFVTDWEHAHQKSIYSLFHNCSDVTSLDLTGLDPHDNEVGPYVCQHVLAHNYQGGLHPGASERAVVREQGSVLLRGQPLVGGSGKAFGSSKASADMAVIDTADTPGYLTGV